MPGVKNVSKAEKKRRAQQSARDRAQTSRMATRRAAPASRKGTFRPREGGNKNPSLAASMLDPWNKSACIPDGSKGAGCFSIKGQAQLGPGAGGSICGFFLALDVNNMTLGSTGGTTSTLVLPTNWSPATQLAAIQSVYGRYRPVSAGIKVYYVGSTTSDSGSLCLFQVPGTVTVNNFAGTNLSNTGGAPQYAQWTKYDAVRNGGQMTWRPEDEEDFQFYTTNGPNENTSSVLPTGTPYLGVIADGLTSAAGAIRIEWIVNFEGQFQGTVFTAGSRVENPAIPGWFEKAMNGVKAVTPFAVTAMSLYGGSRKLLGS